MDAVEFARELYEGLESKQDFSTWVKKRLSECGAIEKSDFIRLHEKMEANNATKIEYIVRLTTAKEMAMLERNEKGKEYRKYLISVEEKYKLDVSKLSPELQMFKQIFDTVVQTQLKQQEIETAVDEKNMTQAELSALSGIGKSSISQYLSGKNEPNYINIKKLAETLQVNESFLDGSEEFMDDESKEFDKNLPIEEAAKIMGKSKQFVRVGLQRGIFPFGSAVKLSSRWTYYISPPKFYEYVGQQK